MSLTTSATAPDAQLPTIHQALADKELLPREHIVDAGYVDSGEIVTSKDDHGVEVLGPVPPDASWQAQANAGFDVSCFVLGWEARRATCPQGHQSTKWSETKDQHLTLQAARQYQRTPEFKARYDVRAGVEGTLSQGLRVCDLRHARYIGLPKTRLQHVLTAAALNVIRVGQWLEDPQLAKTRRAPFLALLSAAA